MATRDLPAELLGVDATTDAGLLLPYPRQFAAGGGSLTSGSLRLCYFTASFSLTAANVIVFPTAAAGATPTLCRVGVYTVDGSSDLALVASTANDTSLFSSTNATTKALQASYGFVQGNRYAVGLLCVTGASAPQTAGLQPGSGAVGSYLPRLNGSVSGQSDLPASISAGSVAATQARPFFMLSV